ncbi:MAG: hypothetical protein JWQ40_90 [Segetibacter sp.]|nr:hypothetical protein [Segetibacter sp.]
MNITGRRKTKYLVIFATAIVIISGYVLYRVKKHAFLDHQLQTIVHNKTNQLYNLSYDSISVNEVDGDLYIRNLYVKGDTAKLLQMIKSGDTNASKMLLDIYIPLLKVVDFRTASALVAKQMECKQVLISDPQVTIYLFPGQAKARNAKAEQEELYKQILGNFKLIKAENVSVTNTRVVAMDFYTKEVKFRTYNTTIHLSDIAIDSTYNQDTTRTLFCKEIEIQSDKVVLGDKANAAEITKASFDTRSEIVTLEKFEYDAYKNKGFFKSKLEGISLKGISWTGPVENSDLTIGVAALERGELETLSDKKSDKKKTANKKSLILTGWIKTFSLTELKLKSLTFVSKSSGAKKKTYTVKNNSFIIKDLLIDRETLLDESLVNRTKEIDIKNEEINLTSEDQLYNYRFEGLTLNTLSKRITIKSIKILPRLNEADFARKMKVQSDRFDAKFNNIECSRVEFEKLLKGEIVIDNLITSGNSINIFHDLSYPVDTISKQGKRATYPHHLLYDLGFPIKINKVIAKKTYIEYKEKNPASQSSGRVRFSNTSFTIDNVSNQPTKVPGKITMDFTSTFLEKIPVSGSFVLYLDNYKKGRFMVDAEINKSFDATILSQLTQPMSMVKIEKGVVNSFRFNIMADTSISQGSLTITYDDIKVTVLKKKGNEYNKKDVLSFLANILVKNKNKAGPGARTANIVLKPDKYRSFFNFIWKSIFTGLRQTLTIKI